MQDQDSNSYIDSDFCNLKMLLDEKVDIGCIATVIEKVGIYGSDSFDRMRSYSPTDAGSRSALFTLEQLKKRYSQFFLDDCLVLEQLSPGTRRLLLQFGWFRDVMPDFQKLGNYALLTNADKPLSTKQRNTYLKVIAALCRHCGIDSTSRSAVGELRMHTEANGLPVSTDTLRKVLKELKDTLE